ncbi:MAG: hypothetical protein KDI13_02920, partial [Alphaproteobacteria bacterium]|nr:hypothetical protein [Alphaproteobacteria bacterium]
MGKKAIKDQKANGSREFLGNQRGNIFFTLFAAIAIVGLIGAGVMATMRGPLTTMVEVNNRAKAESEMTIASRLTLLEATESAANGDCDSDGFVEPLEWVDASGAGPDGVFGSDGGGFLPAAVGSSHIDPWGTEYGYCAWDAGGTIDALTCDEDSDGNYNRLNGNGSPTDETYTVIALISAGPDGVFQTICSGGASPGATKGGDDILTTYTYSGAVAETNGLWNIKSGDPSVAEISKNLEVTGGASFSNGINLTASASALQLGAASMLFPDDTTLTVCNPANDGLLRLNKTGDPDFLEVCDDPTGWVSVALGAPGVSLWQAGTGSDIYYNSGTPHVGIGKTNPGEALDVVGNIAASGNVSAAGVATSGNASVGGTLGVTGATTLSTVNATGAADFDSTLNADGATTLGGTLDVTGASTVTTLNATGAVDFDSTLNVDGAATLGYTLDVTGATTVTTLDASGAVDFGSTLNVDGDISDSNSAVTIADDLSVTGSISGTNITATSAIAAGTTISVNGDQLGPPLGCSATEKLKWTNGSGWSCATDLQGGSGGGAPSLDDLTDVVVPTPGDGDCLVYNSSGGQWENGACAAGSNLGIFEIVGNVIRVKSSAGDYTNDDFVVGSPQTDDDGDTNHDARMFFDKTKGAFRAGTVSGTQWDNASIGNYSTALGNGTTASGISSTAMGSGSTASGGYSTAMGQVTTASGNSSTAMGSNTTASAHSSTALGYGTAAKGQSSTAMGFSTTASGFASTAMGYSAVAGNGTTGSGYGDGSMAIGLIDDAVTITTPSQVTGIQSLGIFMGDQDGLVMASSNTMGLFGGSFVIDPAIPATQLYARGVLDLGAATDALIMPIGDTGNRPTTPINGMIRYNSASDKFEGYQAGAWQDILTSALSGGAANPDRGIQFNSGGDFAADSTFIYTSTGRLGVGTSDPKASADFAGTDALVIPRGITSERPATAANGMIRYNSTSDRFEGYQSDEWQNFLTSNTGAATPDRGIQFNSGGAFAASSNVIYSPQGAFMVAGTYTGTGAPPATGTGTRMFFDPTKAAFRAGFVTGTQWDNANIGKYSIAMGTNTTASGQYSTALGEWSLASGVASTALGLATTASGVQSTAMGYYTKASGNDSVAMGKFVVAGDGTAGSGYGDSSFAYGLGNATFGHYPQVTGQQSVGYFMGVQDDVVFASSNSFGIFGGTMVIDPAIPATHLAADGGLTVDVEGNVGAINFCDETGANCFAPADVASGATGLWENNSGVVRTKDASAPWTTADFVFGSPQLDDDGDANHDARMLFDKSKSAFRAGQVTGTEWNNANIGANSTALGYAVKASGTNTVAIGASSTASGLGAVAIGQSNQATGTYGLALGYSTTASNSYATALGGSTIASGQYSTATGFGNTASGNYSVSGGAFSTASGQASLAMGTVATASGANSLAFGPTTSASGIASIALGNKVTAGNGTAANGLGDGSMAIGLIDDAVTITTPSKVTGIQSMGIFMGDQDGLVMSAANTMGLFGGKMVIDPAVPATQLTARGVLDLGAANDALVMPVGATADRPASAVEGMIRYNSQSDKFEGYQAGAWQDILTSAVSGGASSPNRGIQFNSNGDFAADASFIFTSAGHLNLGSATANQSNFDRALTVGTFTPGQDAGVEITGAITGSDASIGNLAFYNGINPVGAVQAYRSGADNSAAMLFATANAGSFAERMRLSPAGALGINTTSPQTLLDVNGTIKMGYGGEACDASREGAIYYDSATDAFYVCATAGSWDVLSTGGSTPPGAPDRGVQFNSGGSFAADANFTYTSVGDFIVGSSQLDDTGTGSEDNRMFFDVSKGAFRAGTATGTEWNSTNIGDGSIAMGHNAIAKGGILAKGNIALGNAAAATSTIGPSFAIGNSVTSSGPYSISLGNILTSSGNTSVAIGGQVVASNTRAIAIGSEVEAAGLQSIALGLADIGSTSFAKVSGTQSLGIFMGGHENVDFTASKTMGLFGGKMVIDPADPATNLIADTALEVDGTIKMAYGGEACDASREGAIHYDSAADAFYVCATAGSWDVLSTGGSTPPGAPDRGVQFNSGGSFAADANFTYTSVGDFIVGSSQLDDTGTGSEDNRMFFDVSKGAFRAGKAQGTEWDDANVGTNSFAVGTNAQALGSNSVAIGLRSIANGNDAIAIGKDNTSSFVAIGSLLTTSGANSIALGNRAKVTASGTYSMAIGLGAPTGAYPQISGTNSYAVFSGDQGGVDLTSSSTIGFFGGKMVIDPNTPATQLNARGVLDLGAATDALIMPIGDTGNRPSSPIDGMIRYNSASGKFEGYQAGSWQDLITTSGGKWSAGTGDAIYYNSGTPLVGIGTTTPTSSLHVVGDALKFQPSGNSAQITLDNYSASPMLYIAGVDGTVDTYIQSLGDLNISVGSPSPASSANKLAISMDRLTGYVGIRQSTATTALDVAGAIKMDYDSTTCDSTIQGAIRYDSGNTRFDLCDGASWKTIATSSGGSKWTAGSGDAIYYNSGTPLVGIGTTAPEATLDISSTDSVIVPRGTTAQRPSSAINGMIRYNSTTGKFEGYENASWANLTDATPAGSDRQIQFNSGG